MADTSLQIKSKAIGGESTSVTVTDVNPEVNNGALKQFATGLNGLTNNQYENATRIDKTDLDNITPKTAVTITCANEAVTDGGSMTASNWMVTNCSFSATDTVQIYVKPAQQTGGTPNQLYYIQYGNGTLMIHGAGTKENTIGTYKVFTLEDDTHYGAEFSFTVTADE